MKKFLLQSDEGVLEIEKKAVHHVKLLQGDIEIKYCAIDNILSEKIDTKYCPVGSVEFVKLFMMKNNIICPAHLTYPQILREDYYLRRKIIQGLYRDANYDEFIKPLYNIKKFTGNIKSEIILDIPHDYPVFISEPVKFVQEYRFYILNNELIGYGRYDDFDSEDQFIDFELIDDAIWAMKDLNIIGYSLDFGVLDTCQTALIEANDGWSLGLYKGTCSNQDYCELIYQRWKQISNIKEIF